LFGDFFFFSSRRRHTRFSRDWSSDVCSSDLKAGDWRYDIIYPGLKMNMPDILAAIGVAQLPEYFEKTLQNRVEIYEYYHTFFKRSEERRVGKEYRCRWSTSL